MSVENFKRMKCDNCGKIKEVGEWSHYPFPWFIIEVTRWRGGSGYALVKKDACSERCVKVIMHGIKKLPRKEPRCRV